MKFYVATKYQNKARAIEIRNRLLVLARDLGVELECTATWLNQKDWPVDGAELALANMEWAYRCELDVRNSDVVLAITEDVGLGTGGMHVETGIALALGTPIFVLGPPINVFHYHHVMRGFTDEDMFLGAVLRHAGATSKRAAA